MVDYSKPLFNYSFEDLVNGLKEAFPQLAANATAAGANGSPTDGPTFKGRVLYSLPEAEDAFQVSHKTMCLWKKTWMAPAWRQEGRKCMCDFDYAIILMERRKKLAE